MISQSTGDRPIQVHPYLAACPVCRERWERARDLHAEAGNRPDEVSSAQVLYAAILSPFGLLWVAAGPGGLERVEFNVDEPAFRYDLESSGHRVRFAPSALAGVMNQFAEYFAGRRTKFDLPLSLSGSSPFRQAVLRAVAEIPWGDVRSYGEIAYAAGRPGAARAVGSTMATNRLSIVVPCHRVIRGDGTPGEYGYRSPAMCGTAMKCALLAMEGVMFNNLVHHGIKMNGR